MQETRVWSLGQEDPWRRKWQPTPVLLPGESHGGRSLVGYSPWGHKESDMTERLHFHFLSLLPDTLHIFQIIFTHQGSVSFFRFLKCQSSVMSNLQFLIQFKVSLSQNDSDCGRGGMCDSFSFNHFSALLLQLSSVFNMLSMGCLWLESIGLEQRGKAEAGRKIS